MEQIDELQILKDVFDLLQSTSSRLEKESILANNKDNSVFIEAVKFLYDPYIVTGLASSKITKDLDNGWVMSLFDEEETATFVEIIDYLKKNNTGRDADIEKIQGYIKAHMDYKDMLSKIFTKELKLGIQATTLNKVYGEEFVPTFDVMLAQKYSDQPEFVEGKVFQLTTKLDGTRMVAVVDDSIKMFTRQGQQITDMPEILGELKNLPQGYIYDGELIAKTDEELESKDLFRETVSRARRDGVKTGIIFHIFDMVPLSEFKKGVSTQDSHTRKEQLHKLFEENNFEWLKEVEVLYEGTDVNKISEYLEDITSKGGEGVMINLSDGVYECKRTKQLLKVKKFNTADVKVVDVYEGTGKYSGKLGGITIEFEHNGKIWKCDVGSGFTDDERVIYWNDNSKLMGKIVEIKYFEITQDADGIYSMRFPTWLGIIREEKDSISMY